MIQTNSSLPSMRHAPVNVNPNFAPQWVHAAEPGIEERIHESRADPVVTKLVFHGPSEREIRPGGLRSSFANSSGCRSLYSRRAADDRLRHQLRSAWSNGRAIPAGRP